MIKDKYKVKSIKKELCKEWLLHKHYAKRIPSISYAFGLFIDNKLEGVLTIGKPASNSLCEGVCNKENSKYVYELNRLCTNNNLQKNSLSYFVSQTLKQLPQPMIIVSYADRSVGHTGYIYQATNFIYTGLSAKRTDRFDKEQPNKHGRHIKDGILIERPRKHRYIFFIGDKKEVKEFIKKLNYEKKSYPKGNNIRYNADYKPTIQTELF